MKVKINAQIETEVEINIPSYYKSLCHYYKVVSDTNSVMVCVLHDHESIGLTSNHVTFNSGTPDEITEAEFVEKLNGVSSKLSSL